VTTVAAYAPDLMDRSRIAAVAPATVFVTAPGDLAESPADVLVIDLGRPGVIDALPGLAGRNVIGYGSHVDRAGLDAARAAGCPQVLPRSVFFSRAGELLA
jgi:hypothetical protein